MKNRFPELQRLARKLNCTVIDDKDLCMIEVTANSGWSFEQGETSCQMTGYGDNVPRWRHEAIAEAIDRLECEQPDNVPFKAI